MSTPILWILFPTLIAIAAFFFRRWEKLTAAILSGISLLLAIAVWLLPINEQIVLGSWAFQISDRFILVGRQFLLGQDDRMILTSIYLVVAFFLIGSISANVSKIFAPFVFAISAMFVASIAVEPFLYAALFIQLAVLLGVPLLSPPGRPIERGVILYLIFLSFGFPFILLSGWMLTGINYEVSNPNDVLPALVVLGFGFAFLLAVFPLNTWIPMLMEKSHPYSTTFLLTIFPVVVISLLQRFIQNFQWILDFEIVEWMGLLVVVTGGLWAAFQRNLGRLLGYAAIIEIGRSLLIISQSAEFGVSPIFLLPRLVSFGVVALSLSIIRSQTKDLSFRANQGLIRYSPLLAISILTGIFSVAGFPLLAGFPSQYILFTQLSQPSMTFALWGLAGSIGLLMGGLRTLAVFVMGPEDRSESMPVDQFAGFLIIFSLVMITIMGVVPQSFIGVFPQL